MVRINQFDLNDSIQLDKATFIPDPIQTVESLYNYLLANTGNKAYMPYYNKLKQILHFYESHERI